MAIRKILVPTDGSAFSERALRVAVPLASLHGASIVLVQVSQLPPPADGAGGADSASIPAVPFRDALRAQLVRVAARVARQSGVAIEAQLRDGEAVVPELGRAVAEHGADLVVMATHGRGGLSRLWMGSVADALLRDLPSPTLLVRKAPRPGDRAPGEALFPRVLVGLDGSLESERALQATLALLGDVPVHVVLAQVHVVPRTTVSEPWKPDAIRRLTDEYLGPMAARYRTAARVISTRVVVEEDVARALLRLAGEERAFLVAVATHGLTGARRALLGSVADKVVRGVESPVLVVPRGGPARVPGV